MTYNTAPINTEPINTAPINTEPINIVPMDESSTYAVAQIELACFSRPWSENSIKAELDNENAHFFVALCGNNAVGYCGMYIAASEAYIANIAVLPEFRGKGLGKALTQRLIDTAMQKHCSFITLEVRPTNKAAVKLYNKLDFAEVGRRKNFYTHPTEDGLIMTKYF